METKWNLKNSKKKVTNTLIDHCLHSQTHEELDWLVVTLEEEDAEEGEEKEFSFHYSKEKHGNAYPVPHNELWVHVNEDIDYQAEEGDEDLSYDELVDLYYNGHEHIEKNIGWWFDQIEQHFSS
jgi:hypothetical protein